MNLSLKKHRTNYNNKFFLLLIIVYIFLLSLTSIIACFFSFQQRKEELISEMDNTLEKIEVEYQSSIDDFWKIYEPLLDTYNRTTRTVLLKYFSHKPTGELMPFGQLELKQAISQMMLQDSRIEWIVTYSQVRNVNYILYRSNYILNPIIEELPCIEESPKLPKTLRTNITVYGYNEVNDGSSDLETYAIGGGLPLGMGTGSVIAGYKTSFLDKIAQSQQTPIENLSYIILSKDNIVFDSKKEYDFDNLSIPEGAVRGIIEGPNGEDLYINAITSKDDSSLIYYFASWDEISTYSHRNTPRILLILFSFIIISAIIYIIMLNTILGEVNVIREGLDEIGDNNLDYRIESEFTQSGLPEIADSINNMTIKLQENINRAFKYQIKQKEAELSELQSKFNPHFLYNTLEMIRGRCLQNGDEATSKIVSKLAVIFRGFVGSKTFISLNEELAFNQQYLSLFEARYDDSVEVLFDIDSELLQYGIIRNALQPLIENYFIHGFNTDIKCNYILISGESKDKDTYTITVKDNGSGMDEKELLELKSNIQGEFHEETKSYGLKNLHQRIQLFYGEDFGLDIYNNEDKGLSIELSLPKITYEEYQNLKEKA